MRDACPAARTVAIAVGIAASWAGSAAPCRADDVPDPALLEFLGARARAAHAGIDVDCLVELRLVEARRADTGDDAPDNEVHRRKR